MNKKIQDLKETGRELKKLQEIKFPKGRKFIALQQGLGVFVLFTIACIIKPAIIPLMPLAMIAIGLPVAYMGGNAAAKFADKKK